MKKTILIIGGFIIILAIGIVWIYLFLFGAPENTDEIFAQFGIGNTAPIFDNVVKDSESPFTVVDDVRAGSLRQLTTRPVAGMTFLDGNTVRYIERGTGYIYDIPLSGGGEQQVTYTTHSKVTSAQFSPSGSRVAFEIETETGRDISVGAIGKSDTGESILTSAKLPTNAHDAIWDTDGTFLHYILGTTEGAEAHKYHTVNQTDEILFTIPFSEVRPLWGETTFLYTTPTASLQGYLYKVTNGVLQYVREGGLGLTAFTYENGFVTTEASEEGATSFAYENNTIYRLPLGLFPEKCTPWGGSRLMCASPSEFTGSDYPDSWYKGVFSSNDLLWSIDITAKEARLLANPQMETGRIIDVAKIVSNTTGDSFLLLNKNDMTLWLFTPQF